MTTSWPTAGGSPGTAPTPTATARLEPFVVCVAQVGTSRWQARFAYRNLGPEVLIEVGRRNEVVPGEANQGQPERFVQDGSMNAFEAAFTGGSLTWVLDGRIAIATRYSPRC